MGKVSNYIKTAISTLAPLWKETKRDTGNINLPMELFIQGSLKKGMSKDKEKCNGPVVIGMKGVLKIILLMGMENIIRNRVIATIKELIWMAKGMAKVK